MAPNQNDPPAPERAPGGGRGMSKREALAQQRAEAAEAQIARHQAEWEQAISKAEAAEAQVRELREALAWYADAVQRIAHRMPAPNEFTPIFTQLAIDMRQTLFNTKDKSDG